MSSLPQKDVESEGLAKVRRSAGVLKVLILAEAANPDWSSVPLIGWNLSRAISKFSDVHIVTQIRNRDAILRRGLLEGIDFTAIDNEMVASRFGRLASKLQGGKGKGWTTVAAFSSLAYYSFEREVWRVFKDRLRAGEFDLVHRVTPVSPTSQSPIVEHLWKIDVPFVIGPLNGGVPWPRSFRGRQYAEREWLSHLRWLHRLMPSYQATRKMSAKIFCGSRYTESEMPRSLKEKCVYIPENGVDLTLFNKSRVPKLSLPLHGAFVGRLVPYKGVDILIDAATPFLKAGSLKLQIIGDGPQKEDLLKKVATLGLENCIAFRGWMDQTKMQQVLAECDFLALPSIREFGGGVVLEAMALGVTPIVADYGGPGELVDETTGIRVAFSNEADLREGFGRAIDAVIKHPSTLNDLGQAARARVKLQYTWEAKARQIVDHYKTLLSDLNQRIPAKTTRYRS